MQQQSSPLQSLRAKINRYEMIVEVATWAVMIAIIFGVRFIPQSRIEDSESYLLVGGIVSFALIYYLVIYRYFPRSKRLYFKDIADIVLIGILIHLMKDWGQYFYALFFLPIAAAALSLEFISALLIAVIASLFVVFEIFLGSQGLAGSSELYQGFWQIGLILIITVFCRVLAVQLRQEKLAKEESLMKQKFLEEEAVKQKEFLSMTSHQLLTPLSIIRGFSSLLEDNKLGQLDTKQKDAVGEIYENSKRMVDLVTELLSISHIQSGKIELKMKDHNLDELICKIVEQFNNAIPKKDVELIYEKPNENQRFEFDKDKIRQVIYSLIDNALKYTPKGKITVSLSFAENRATVTVRDEGSGIANEDTHKLFQPFFRGQNILELDNKGTGLGLYISKLLIEEHHGKIEAYSEGRDKGSTFKFWLPLVQLSRKEND